MTILNLMTVLFPPFYFNLYSLKQVHVERRHVFGL